MTMYYTSDDVDKKHAVIVRIFNLEFFSGEEREREFVKMQVWNIKHHSGLCKHGHVLHILNICTNLIPLFEHGWWP